MIRLSVYYPSSEGATFDHDYYRDSHIPLCLETWGLGAEQVQIDKGLDGPHVAAVHFQFESMDEMQKAMGVPGTAEVQADVPNYTTITPQMQVSEIVD
jgi:uncharacterized protein (TIGR02118 family)